MKSTTFALMAAASTSYALGGLTPREAFPIVRRLSAESNVVGFELVELKPIIDPTYVSAMNANRFVRECHTGVAMRKMGLTGKH